MLVVIELSVCPKEIVKKSIVNIILGILREECMSFNVHMLCTIYREIILKMFKIDNRPIWNTQNCGNFEPIISFQISVGKCLILGFTIEFWIIYVNLWISYILPFKLKTTRDVITKIVESNHLWQCWDSLVWQPYS